MTRTRISALLAAITASTVAALATGTPAATASTPGGDVRLSNDSTTAGGYTSVYTLATGTPASDPTLAECSRSRGRQNEPSVAIDPRDTTVVVGSSNDYCGVYNGTVDADGAPIPSGPIWLGYYRSTNGGTSFASSLVPGYPGDGTPYAALSRLRTSGAGDPVLAWDRHGRLFVGTETSGDPGGTAKTFGDVGVATFVNPQGANGPTNRDGLAFQGSVVVNTGTSAPSLKGVFNDKTAIEADRTGGAHDGNVYFAWSRFNNNHSNIYFSRSTDHGVTFSNPMSLTSSQNSVQDPEISVTANGHVYVTWGSTVHVGNKATDVISLVKSTDGGATFSRPVVLASYLNFGAVDTPDPQPSVAQRGSDDPVGGDGTGEDAGSPTSRDCGTLASACKSGYVFFRHDTAPRSTANQLSAPSDERIYVAFEASKPGTEVSTGTTYGTFQPGTGSQGGVYFMTYDGSSGAKSTPKLVDPQAKGHQLFPDLAIEGSGTNAVLHLLWWDSRNDPCYSPALPIGNCVTNGTKTVGPALDVFATSSSDGGGTFATPVRVTDDTSAPNYDQFSGRTVPFAGDYLWISAVGRSSFGTWTDWRNTVAGDDPRNGTGAYAGPYGPDVLQCRTQVNGAWTGDTCPRAGGLDQNIYGDQMP